MSDQSLWLLAAPWLAGGLAGSALTLISQWIIRCWQRPRLKILFRDDEDGCRINTNVVGETEPTQSYVRLKVQNYGRSTALGVSVCATELSFKAPGAGRHTFKEEVLDLMLASQIKPVLYFRLAPGAHRYVDVAYTIRKDCSHRYVFSVEPARLREQGFGTKCGIYGAKLFVSAENSKAIEKHVTWSWDGKFPGLKIIGN